VVAVTVEVGDGLLDPEARTLEDLLALLIAVERARGQTFAVTFQVAGFVFVGLVSQVIESLGGLPTPARYLKRDAGPWPPTPGAYQ
jgi:hypothetical protein